MQNHLPAAVALLAPYVNSYRRYVPDFAAPINLEWGRDNRTTGLRVPISGPAARRVENRLPGMDCNPYLGIAATPCLRLSGPDGRQDAARRNSPAIAYIDIDDMPYNLGDALDLLEEDTALREVLGDGVLQGLRFGKAQRIQRVPAGHQPVGTRASAAERLRRDEPSARQ